MCAIAYYLERSGICTTSISLVRENAVALQPPRSLWVPFPLGRPLGQPDERAFQHRVIAHALELLERPCGPVLDDFPEDAETVAQDAVACPVSFAPQSQTDTWQGRLGQEVRGLQPWYAMAVERRRGRSTVGASGASVEDCAAMLGTVLDGAEIESMRRLKLVIEDLKAYVQEALTARPGSDWREIHRKLWHESVLGKALQELATRFADNPSLEPFNRVLLPREVENHERD